MVACLTRQAEGVVVFQTGTPLGTPELPGGAHAAFGELVFTRYESWSGGLVR